MALILAYLGVVLIWATTPLAIKWSSLGVSFIFGVSMRMAIGAVCLLMLMVVLRRRLPCHKAAILTYLAVAIQLYLSMILTYWGAQYIPSGWISVIFGLSPFMTAFMAASFLQERSLGWGKLLAYLLGVVGLAIMFDSAIEFSPMAVQGMVAVLLATFIHAASAVWVKQLKANLSAVSQISGGLFLALPLYGVTWYLLDQGQMPTVLPTQTLWAIIYLGCIATTFGFAFYYYVLARLPATNVAMINLMTPVLSLWLGHSINQEPITLKIFSGTLLILLALVLHEVMQHWQTK